MSEQPTARSSPLGPTKQQPSHASELALEAALLVMQNGGSTVAANRSFTNILKGYNEENVTAIWRLDFVAATNEGQSSAVVRPVGPIGVNLSRASEVAVLCERAAKGGVALAALRAELERIKHLPSPYGRWVTVLAAASSSACFSQVAGGGDWGSFGIAFVAAGIGRFVRSVLQARKLDIGPATLLCSVLSAMIASVGLSLGLSQVESATLMGSVYYLVPGLPLINGFVDVASHKHLAVGIGRIANATYLFSMLGIAIALGHVAIR